MDLSLSEELALVAFDPARGSLTGAGDPKLRYSLAGAVIMDLVLRGAATMEHGRLESTTDTGDPLLDSALARIRSSGRSRPLKHWVTVLPGRSFGLRQRVLQRLVDGGILEPRRERILGLFEVDRYGLRAEQRRSELLSAVRQALIGEAMPGQRMAALLGLLSTAGLIDRAVAKEERRAARRKARAIAIHDAGGRAVSAAVADTQAAVVAGVTAAVVSAAGVGGSSGHGH